MPWISAGIASGFAPRIGVRPVAIAGMVLTILGLLFFARVPVHGSYAADVLPGMLLSSLGMGAVFMTTTLVATTGLRDEDQGLASGLFNTSQQVGGALGLAILSTIAAGQTHGLGSAAQVHGFHYAFLGVLRPHRTGDRDLVAKLGQARADAKTGKPRPRFYASVAIALAAMATLILLRQLKG